MKTSRIDCTRCFWISQYFRKTLTVSANMSSLKITYVIKILLQYEIVL